jgi:hypothetical protein
LIRGDRYSSSPSTQARNSLHTPLQSFDLTRKRSSPLQTPLYTNTTALSLPKGTVHWRPAFFLLPAPPLRSFNDSIERETERGREGRAPAQPPPHTHLFLSSLPKTLFLSLLPRTSPQLRTITLLRRSSGFRQWAAGELDRCTNTSLDIPPTLPWRRSPTTSAESARASTASSTTTHGVPPSAPSSSRR